MSNYHKNLWALSSQKILLVILSTWITEGYALDAEKNLYHHPIYIAGLGGWGSTTWGGLVPRPENQNWAISMSTPLKVKEGGEVWGLALGYELTPFFAIEADYMRFPNAQMTFDEYSLYSLDQNTLILNTSTQTASLNGRIMLVLPDTNFRLFSSVGIASVFRDDQINSDYRISPTFAFGFNVMMTDRLMAEIGSNYTAGYGESEINPVLDFVPFLYSVYVKLALRFG